MMQPTMQIEQNLIQRVRAIILTENNSVILIKRIKPNDTPPYWVAPGGGVEEDESLHEALHRELYEELGAKVDILDEAFVLRHHKAGKELEEHFFLCHLADFDLSHRHGPEFDDPARGEYIIEEIPLTESGLTSIHIKTDELRGWLLDQLEELVNESYA